jgi:cysteine synthase
MRMLGAKVIVTPKKDKGTGMVKKAEELCAKHGWFLCHQVGRVLQQQARTKRTC